MKIKEFVSSYKKAQKNNCERMKCNIADMAKYIDENIDHEEFIDFLDSLCAMLVKSCERLDEHEENSIYVAISAMSMFMHSNLEMIDKLKNCPQFEAEFS